MRNEHSRKALRTAVTVIISVLAVILPFVTVFFVGICTPPQYTDTYYGEALAVVRPREGCGEVLLCARSAYGCAEARIAIVGQ